MKTFFVSVATFFLFLTFSLEACTGIMLVAKDRSIVNGRTVEFGVTIDLDAVVVPRGYSFTGTTPLGKGLTYKGKYAAVGMISYDNLSIVDGVNEKGLSIGMFYFPGFAEYTEIDQDNQKRALSPIDFPNWILTQFASIEEVKKEVKNVVIAPTVISVWGSEPPPFHYIVYDKKGNSLVIEPVGGELMIYDNPIGTFTNSPTFDWHMTNLRNYINLRSESVSPLEVDGLLLAPFGQGSGMVGLPGDFTPPSRFVQAAIFSYTAIPPKNAKEGVLQTFHILNQFDIPIGVARELEDGIVHTDYTMLTSVKDPENLCYYFRTYDDQSIKMVDLKQFDFNAKTVKKASSSGYQPILDISSKLKSS